MDDDLSIEEHSLCLPSDNSHNICISIESIATSAECEIAASSTWLSQSVDQRWKQLMAFGGPDAVQKYWLTGPPVAKYLPRAAIKFQKKV